MNYILLNRKNIVVDILTNLRYIKLQSSPAIIIACEKNEGTGVIGSDGDTHYTLIKADKNSDPNAVYIIEKENLPLNIIPYYTIYNPKTNEFEARYALSELQNQKQEENKKAFSDYLASHPLTWIDDKKYGITQEDQAEINLNLSLYKNAPEDEKPTLEWHARHEESKLWTVENLTALNLAISKFVYPIYHKMQQYKTKIYNSGNMDELNKIEINYDN